MMVNYLVADPRDAQQVMNDTRGCHAKFLFMERMFRYHLDATIEVDSYNALVAHHRVCALRPYLLYLVGMSKFMDKRAYYAVIVYLRYFINWERISKYNWWIFCLVYLYSNFGDDCLWKTRHMTTSKTLFTIIYFHLYCQ